MAFTYQAKSWTISGEKEFENHFTLLNPTLSVVQIVINEAEVYLQLAATENGGVFVHNLNIRYSNASGETSVDAIVDAAILAAFPDATLVQ